LSSLVFEDSEGSLIHKDFSSQEKDIPQSPYYVLRKHRYEKLQKPVIDVKLALEIDSFEMIAKSGSSLSNALSKNLSLHEISS
jgi:hypothetical protein